MNRPDALSILLLLRRAEVAAARQHAAEAAHRQREAESAADRMTDAINQERASAAQPAYADWFATAQAGAVAQLAEARRAEAGASLAQQALGAARLAEKIALDASQEQRRLERRRRSVREQRLLDDL